MSEGPTIGDWTQYGWIPDGASSFPAMVRLRNAAWMVYYEPGTVVQRERAENVKLREELEAAKHDLQVFSANLARLGADNAKLRELCEDIRICARDNQCSLCYLASGKCEFADRMRELGVDTGDAID